MLVDAGGRELEESARVVESAGGHGRGRRLVDDGRVLQRAEVEHTHGAVVAD